MGRKRIDKAVAAFAAAKIAAAAQQHKKAAPGKQSNSPDTDAGNDTVEEQEATEAEAEGSNAPTANDDQATPASSAAAAKATRHLPQRAATASAGHTRPPNADTDK